MAVRIIQGEPRHLNWRRQPVDLRDHVLSHGPESFKIGLNSLPSFATTRNRAEIPVRDQGSLGSCTQNAGAEAMGFVYTVSTGKPDPMFSRLFGYWLCRVKMEGVRPDDDSGCNVRDVFKTYQRYGICLESTWTYDISRFSVEPDDLAKSEAMNHQAVKYYSCSPYREPSANLHVLKTSIADGWPVIFGFDCFDSLQSDEVSRTGHIPFPESSESSIGGHCVIADTYDDNTGEVSGVNSWGLNWGDKGRFYLPYSYWTNGLASDAHTLRIIEV